MDAAALPVEKGRLIFLVPDCLVSNIELMNKIYQMAARDQREMFYLALVDGSTKMLAATRSVATLKALVSDGRFNAASQVVEASRWMAALREIYRPGDMVVCLTEQQVRSGLFRTVPASDVVRDELQAPVRTLSGFYHPEQVQIGQWLGKAAYWAGLLAIVGVFFFLEVRLEQTVFGVARTLLLIVLLLLALGAGMFWNKISGQQ